MTLASLPLILILSSGNKVDSMDLGGGLAQFFGSATLGNIGDYGDFACNSTNLATLNQEIEFQCERGSFQKLVSVGLNKVRDQNICIDRTIEKSNAILGEDGEIVKTFESG